MLSLTRRLGWALGMVVGLVGVTGCAGLQRSFASLPSPEVLNALPEVQWGQPKPTQGDYIVHLRPVDLLTAEARVEGSLFDKPDQKTLGVHLKRDVYLYKHWVSFDKLTWHKGNELIGGKVSFKLPDYESPEKGEILIQMNEKPGH